MALSTSITPTILSKIVTIRFEFPPMGIDTGQRWERLDLAMGLRSPPAYLLISWRVAKVGVQLALVSNALVSNAVMASALNSWHEKLGSEFVWTGAFCTVEYRYLIAFGAIWGQYFG
ncbi:MAG: hypothetical protein HC812_03715 [Leptolyngbya sp. RL_3_1]|nr:hypothetical protein [Leptolyngbya sp. RL_3_1]